MSLQEISRLLKAADRICYHSQELEEFAESTEDGLMSDFYKVKSIDSLQSLKHLLSCIIDELDNSLKEV